MATVDAKGRIVLPKPVRDRLGISPGSEVVVREADGRVIVEPQGDPSDIIDDLEEMIAAASAERDLPTVEELEGEPKRHVEVISRQATGADRE